MTIKMTGLAASLIAMSAVSAAAADSGEGRSQLDKVLAVLRHRPGEASRACIMSMARVQDTERQIRVRGNRPNPGKDPDLDREMLALEYENSMQICGVDADRVCRAATAPDISGVCQALHTDGSQ